LNELKKRLDEEIKKRNSLDEVCEEKPDPILIAKIYKDPHISLICSLFAYGSVKAIVAFLRSLDFSLLEADESKIKKELSGHFYRFQNSQDVINIFIALRRLKLENPMENIFMNGYEKEKNVLDGLSKLITKISSINRYDSRGYRFLLSSPPDKTKTNSTSPLKRWNMFLRWMVRDDQIDFGLWKDINRSDLLIPLDTHTFNVSNRLGLLNRKRYDLKSALLLTGKLKEFDPLDPVKYDLVFERFHNKLKTSYSDIDLDFETESET